MLRDCRVRAYSAKLVDGIPNDLVKERGVMDEALIEAPSDFGRPGRINQGDD